MLDIIVAEGDALMALRPFFAGRVGFRWALAAAALWGLMYRHASAAPCRAKDVDVLFRTHQPSVWVPWCSG